MTDRSPRRVLAVTLTLIAAALGLPGAASAATQWTLDGKVTVRNGSGDYVLGYATGNDAGPNTPRSDHFNAQASEDGWLYGWVDGPGMGSWGGLPRCGWVMPRRGAMHENGRTAPDRCPPPNGDYYSPSNPLAPRNLFDAGSWFQGTGAGTVYTAEVVACPTGAYGYLNYDPSAAPEDRFRNRYPEPLPVGRGTRTDGGRGAPSGYSGFGIRYYAGDAVMIKDSRGGGDRPTWFFMRRNCVKELGGTIFTPQLAVGRTSWEGRTVRFSGTARRNLPPYIGTARQTLDATFVCSAGTVSRRVAFRRTEGVTAWSARLTAPSSCRRGRVAIAYGGDKAFGPQRVAKGVRRRG